MQCPSCGSENTEVAFICKNCGIKLTGVKSVSNTILNEGTTTTKSENSLNKNPRVKISRKNGFFYGLLRMILVIFVIFMVFILGNFSINKYKEYVFWKNLSGGFDIKAGKDYKTIWQNTMSDIDGMTVWDKYKMGLAINDDSDTDGDGLSDKEEIEIYNSNPLKISTAGDLYTDKYKVQNGMNVNQFYEYEEEKIYPYNECSEIILEAKIPTDFNAVVINHTGKNSFNGNEVLAQYEIYNYSGKVSIDLNSILTTHKKNIRDIAIYVFDGKTQKKYNFNYNGGVVTLTKNLNSEFDYEIFVTEKSFLNDMAITFGVTITDSENSENEVNCAGFVSCSPLLSTIINRPINIYYQEFLDEEKTEISKTKVVNHAQNYLKEANPKYYSDESIIGTNALEINMRYKIFSKIFPFFDVTYMNADDMGFLNLLYMYYSYADKVEFENKEQIKKKESSTSGFDIEKDELPFKNFKTEVGTTGNCAGISHLTTYVYNTGTFAESGSYSYEGTNISWNIGEDYENDTLRDIGLSDYKTDTFVLEHSTDGITLNKDLSVGEYEFVKMIEANYMQGNYFVNMLYQNVYGGVNSHTAFDYALIDEMKTRLESGKILDVYMRMSNGTGHTVNVYDYEIDKNNDDIIWFNVYDCNFPMEKTGDNKISKDGFRIKITKKHKADGNGYRFEYSYFPIEGKTYGATSNKSVNDTPLFIVMDENWNDINPVAKYDGDIYRFKFNYVGTAEKTEEEIVNDGTADHSANCVFRDSYFAKPSCGDNPNDGYNSSLATCSLSFAMSAFGSNDGGTEDYSNKYKNAKGFLISTGFSDFEYNDWYVKKPQSDSIGVVIANKNISVKKDDEVKDYTLIAVAVRGGGYESEWAGNFTIGENGQHYGFSIAKEQVIDYLQKYITDKEIRGDIKLWIVGYSRAAATVNLVAGAIDDGVVLGETISLSKEDMYAYCFEPPMGALKTEIENESNYYNIYCIINKSDPVTKVAMTDLGFTTYGVKHFLPSSISDGNSYEEKQAAMLQYYKELDSYNDIERELKEKGETAYPVDNFKMKKIVLKYLLPGGKSPIQDDEENNWTQAAYLDTMISTLTLEEIKSRKNYVDNYQNLIRVIFTAKYGTLFPNEPYERCQNFFNILIEKLGSNVFWADFVKSTLTHGITGKTSEEIIDNIVAESLNEAGINAYNPDVLRDFKTAITDLIVPFVVSHPNYTTTALCNLNKLAAAHYPELCLAWLRVQDSDYSSEPYSFNWSGSYRIIKINCPVNVIVYNKNGNVVAKIKNNKVNDIKNSSILSLIDEDDTKIIYLPTNAEYSLKVIATDKGTVNISINDFSGEKDTIVKKQTYEDISVEKEDVVVLNIPQYPEAETVNSSSSINYQIKDKNGTNIDVSNIYLETDVYNRMFYVKAVSEDYERGYVIGSGIRCEGDFALLNAYGNEGYHFVGWYDGDILVSEEQEYRFKVTSDVLYVAKFKEGNEALEISDVIDFIELHWRWIMTLVSVIITVIIIIFRWKH